MMLQKQSLNRKNNELNSGILNADYYKRVPEIRGALFIINYASQLRFLKMKLRRMF